MKKSISRVINTALYRLSPKKCIIFESCPDYTDNSKAVYDEMVRRGIDKKYRLIWLSFDNKTKSADYLSINTEGIKYKYYYHTAKAIITCNRFFEPVIDEQFSIYLGHGIGFKNTREYLILPPRIRYALTPSEQSTKVHKKAYRCDDSKLVPLGYPRNDEFNHKKIDLNVIFGSKFEHIIAWYPTFRQDKVGTRLEGAFAIPIIHNKEYAVELNAELIRRNALIVIKPHFVQNTDLIKNYQLSNIKFIDNTFFEKKQITSYSFLNSCSALITDYSTVYFDYLLCNKPIGLIFEDIDSYKVNPGLVEDYETLVSGGVKIYTLEELKSFIKDVCLGFDILKEEREKNCRWAHYSKDGRNSERVVDFIIKEGRL